MMQFEVTRSIRRISHFFIAAALVFSATAARASSPDDTVAAKTAQDNPAGDTRYGAFGLLDHRSRYGQFWFPEPFRMDETDVDNELRFDWLHQEGKGTVTDEGHVEFEKAFGLTTVEVEIPYVRESEVTTDPITGATGHDHTWGAGNIEVSVRRPIYQFVSRDEFFDNTVGAAFEVGIPTNSAVSRNPELVGKVFDSLRLGEHFSLQGIAGYSVLTGPGDDGGTRSFEYGVVAGYNIAHKNLGVAHIEQLIPIFELTGETPLNKEQAGHNNLSGTIGLRANLQAIGALQPRLGIGYVFPIDAGARDELKWGVVTSLVFEY